MSGVALSKEEEDFVKWMDEVDLEEVNLLDGDETVDVASTEQERERLSGERQKAEPPKWRWLKSLGIGWSSGGRSVSINR